MKRIVTLLPAALLLAHSAQAQSPGDPAIDACRSSGLIALKELSPSVKDVIFDMETVLNFQS
jgi:hypothetical protein